MVCRQAFGRGRFSKGTGFGSLCQQPHADSYTCKRGRRAFDERHDMGDGKGCGGESGTSERLRKRDRFCESGSIRPYHIVSKLFWFKKYKRELYDRTAMFLDCSNYITYRLTSRFTIDRSMATNYHFYNIFEKKKWDERLAEKLQIDLRRFPKVCDCHEVIGHLTKEAAEELDCQKQTDGGSRASDTAVATLNAGIFSRNQWPIPAGQGAAGHAPGMWGKREV